MKTLKEIPFDEIAKRTSELVGSARSFAIAVVFVLLWLATGPYFHFSTSLNFMINSTTTIITFLMVFLIQASQNNDTRAIHLKLDEVLNSIENASNEFIGAENMTQTERTKLAEKIEGAPSDGSER